MDLVRHEITMARANGGHQLGLSGKINSSIVQQAMMEISQLRTTLEEIDLSANGLVDLPNETTHLVCLRKLLLQNNQLSSVGLDFQALRQLEVLYIHENKLTYLPDTLKELHLLEVLDVGRNLLTSLPTTLSALASLKILHVGGNKLAAFPAELCRLSSLEELDLSENELSHLPPEIGRLSKLHLLYLSDNRLSYLPQEIGHLKNLHELDVSNNFITQLPIQMGELGQLQIFYATGNHISYLPDELGRLANLEVLYVGQNQLLEIPPALGQLKGLQAVSFAKNRIAYFPPELCSLPSLRMLDLGHNHLSSLPNEFRNLRSLKVLDLQDNRFGALPAVVCQVDGLNRLCLNDNSIVELGPDLSKLQQLQSLEAANNQINVLPEVVGSIGALAVLDLGANQIHDMSRAEDRDCLSRMTRLNKLSLSSNRLRAVPPELGAMRSLEELYLNDNELTAVPSELGNLLGIRVLDLTNNPLASPWRELYDKGVETLLNHLRGTGHPAPRTPVPAPRAFSPRRSSTAYTLPPASPPLSPRLSSLEAPPARSPLLTHTPLAPRSPWSLASTLPPSQASILPVSPNPRPLSASMAPPTTYTSFKDGKSYYNSKLPFKVRAAASFKNLFSNQQVKARDKYPGLPPQKDRSLAPPPPPQTSTVGTRLPPNPTTKSEKKDLGTPLTYQSTIPTPTLTLNQLPSTYPDQIRNPQVSNTMGAYTLQDDKKKSTLTKSKPLGSPKKQEFAQALTPVKTVVPQTTTYNPPTQGHPDFIPATEDLHYLAQQIEVSHSLRSSLPFANRLNNDFVNLMKDLSAVDQLRTQISGEQSAEIVDAISIRLDDLRQTQEHIRNEALRGDGDSVRRLVHNRDQLRTQTLADIRQLLHVLQMDDQEQIKRRSYLNELIPKIEGSLMQSGTNLTVYAGQADRPLPNAVQEYQEWVNRYAEVAVPAMSRTDHLIRELRVALEAEGRVLEDLRGPGVERLATLVSCGKFHVDRMKSEDLFSVHQHPHIANQLRSVGSELEDIESMRRDARSLMEELERLDIQRRQVQQEFVNLRANRELLVLQKSPNSSEVSWSDQQLVNLQNRYDELNRNLAMLQGRTEQLAGPYPELLLEWDEMTNPAKQVSGSTDLHSIAAVPSTQSIPLHETVDAYRSPASASNFYSTQRYPSVFGGNSTMSDRWPSTASTYYDAEYRLSPSLAATPRTPGRSAGAFLNQDGLL